jgi:hypothetical protein
MNNAFGFAALPAVYFVQVRAREPSSGFCWDGPKLALACQNDRKFGLAFFYRDLELVAGRVRVTGRKESSIETHLQ